MRKLLLGLLLTIAGLYSVHGQCSVPAGFVCITQTQADRIAKDLDELKAARDAIAKLTSTIALSDSERVLAQKALSAANDVIAAKDKVALDYQQIISIQAKALELYSALVEKMTAQLNKPASAWSKFARTVEKIAFIALGIAFGRNL